MKGRTGTKLLPYLLFAYREVPQDSTGYSPFELLYGWSVRGPLDVLKETWVAGQRTSESVLSHVLNMQEKLAKMQDIVQENMTGAQRKQKQWYDRSARMREFQTGDQVLVLLPTITNKLAAKWQGPYRVKERVGSVNYRVEMHDHRKKNRVFHVNMLKKWHAQVADVNWMQEEGADVDIEDEIQV